MSASPHTTTIRITLRGGIIQAAEAPDGRPAYIEVFDYDTHGIHPDDLEVDSAGDLFWRYIA